MPTKYIEASARTLRTAGRTRTGRQPFAPTWASPTSSSSPSASQSSSSSDWSVRDAATGPRRSPRRAPRLSPLRSRLAGPSLAVRATRRDARCAVSNLGDGERKALRLARAALEVTIASQPQQASIALASRKRDADVGSAEADQKWLSAGLNLSTLARGRGKLKLITETGYSSRMMVAPCVHSVAMRCVTSFPVCPREAQHRGSLSCATFASFERPPSDQDTTPVRDPPLAATSRDRGSNAQSSCRVLLDSQIRREEARDEAELTRREGLRPGDGSGQYAPRSPFCRRDL